MAMGVDGMRAGRVVWKTVLLTVGTLGFVVCLTMLFQSMRSVMEIGGSCASGGPYEISRPCPTGVAWIMPTSIFGGLAFVALGAFGVFRQGGPRPYLFAWSALFLSLGWNFFEYGFDAPDGSAAAGWIVCGVVFAVMGGVPLVFLLTPSGARTALWGPKADDDGSVTTSSRVRRAIPIGPLPRQGVAMTPGPPRPPGAPATPGPPVSPNAAAGAWPAPAPAATWPATAPAPRAPFVTPGPDAPGPSDEPATSSPASGDLVERLARLADLHRSGALDDDEYERAKEQVLGDGRAP